MFFLKLIHDLFDAKPGIGDYKIGTKPKLFPYLVSLAFVPVLFQPFAPAVNIMFPFIPIGLHFIGTHKAAGIHIRALAISHGGQL